MARGETDSNLARKIVTYTVRQVGGTWHWEVLENEKLIDSGTADSMVNARVLALLAAMKHVT